MYLKVFDVQKKKKFYGMGDVKFSWENHWSDDGKQSHRENDSRLERLANRCKDPNFHIISVTRSLHCHELFVGGKNTTVLNNDNKHEGLSQGCPIYGLRANSGPATDFR